MTLKTYLEAVESKTDRTEGEEVALYLGAAFEEMLSQLDAAKKKTLTTRFLFNWGQSVLNDDVEHP